MPLHTKLRAKLLASSLDDGSSERPKVILLGSGALTIGQAGEFDYSGNQAMKALEEEGIHVILINPNIATVQTDPLPIAEHDGPLRTVYLYPIEPEWVERIIIKERPDAIIGGFGGQTAINCLNKLDHRGVLEKHDVLNLGSSVETIRITEDRDLFSRKMRDIGVPIPVGNAASSVEEAMELAGKIGYPLIIRAAYALGGLGSGFAKSDEELVQLLDSAFTYSPQVLLEKSLHGWKELEYEVMRDSAGNTVTICNMENLDPLGIHTGESIVIAPSQTLADEEYQLLRSSSIKIANALNIVGECNVQFALDPESQDYFVIEVNARLSRSSALASKATGYPIAYVAAKVVLGYHLLELRNPLTNSTSAFFEPALDYVTVKIPKWNFSKFPGVSRRIGPQMKSVGEVMAIGRSFPEAMQKAVRMAYENPLGILDNVFRDCSVEELEKELVHPTDQRIFAIFELMKRGTPFDSIYDKCKMDKWFLAQIGMIVAAERTLPRANVSHSGPVAPFYEASREELLYWKQMGFSDEQLVVVSSSTIPHYERSQERILKACLELREIRKEKKVVPYAKKIDSTAAEFPTPSNYLYLTYHGDTHDIDIESEETTEKESPVVILGGGSYKIGSSVEFDWCSVACSKYIRREGHRSVVINHNPETVSTDFNVSDRLYFEELTVERVLDILELEKAVGVIPSMGGQIPNCLALPLTFSGVRLLGHSAQSIDLAEDRSRFSSLLDELGIGQPRWKAVNDRREMDEFINSVGFPIMVRPSYVLSGKAMKVAYNRDSLERYLTQAREASDHRHITVSEFFQNALEIEVDGVAQNGEVIISIISEHLERAGVHSGDSTIILPPQNIQGALVEQARDITRKIAKGLELNGPFNIQLLAASGEVKVIECNVRASRSFPFVSKVTGINLAALSTKVILGKDVAPVPFKENCLKHVGVKMPMFSFARLAGADPLLGVEMQSTGEVGCIGKDFEEAFHLALLSTGYRIPKKGILLIADALKDDKEFLDLLQSIALTDIPLHKSWNPAIESEELINRKEVDLVVGLPCRRILGEDKEAFLRKSAILHGQKVITDQHLFLSFIRLLQHLREKKEGVELLPLPAGEMWEWD